MSEYLRTHGLNYSRQQKAIRNTSTVIGYLQTEIPRPQSSTKQGTRAYGIATQTLRHWVISELVYCMVNNTKYCTIMGCTDIDCAYFTQIIV